ncbi:MAG TPA: response regulator [Myxococcaceae bacterium]|nr:response regulator [Myxococcaceae bacterium]
MPSPARILAVDDDATFLKIVEDHLVAAGMEVHTLREPTRVVPEAKAFSPNLILMNRAMRVLTGGEVLRSLRAFSETAFTPVAFIVADAGERELIRSIQAGAVDVMHKPFGPEHVNRIRSLLIELQQRPGPVAVTREEEIARNFVDFARRTQMHGTLVVNRGTPFEGRVVFQSGRLLRADYGPLAGVDAIRELLLLEDGVFELDGTIDRPPLRIAESTRDLTPHAVTPVPGNPNEMKPRLLVVDDEPHLRRLFATQLAKAGFEVELAGDGQEAVTMALATPFDTVIADLNMPQMDGWEMLKILKQDHRTREVPVIFLSAHEDYRETLKAARSGAHDYLAKTGRSEHVVQSALQVVTPRIEAMFELVVQQPMKVRVQLLGLQWFLRAVTRIAGSGLLELEDEWGRYTLAIEDGQPLWASADMKKRRADGVAAFAAMLVARFPQGVYTPGSPIDDVGSERLDMSMENLIQRTCEKLNNLENRLTAAKLAQATTFEVDHELYDLYRKIASDKRVELARAVCEQRMPTSNLPAAVKLPADQVTEGLRDLLRRGVIRFPA